MKKIFLLVLISITFLSCSSKTQSALENIIDNFSFNNTISNSTEIIIKLYDSKETGRKTSDIESFTPKKEFKATNKKQFESFNNIFSNAEKTGYCCCPTAIYSIHFMNKKETLDLFYVDTIESKNKIRIYEAGFQYSYIVEKKKWKNFLDEIDNRH
jgi:hypothetical protein